MTSVLIHPNDMREVPLYERGKDDQMRYELVIPAGSIIFLGIEKQETDEHNDYLTPCATGHDGWLRTDAVWKVNPRHQVFRRTPLGYGLMGYDVDVPGYGYCILLYDENKQERLPEYVTRRFSIEQRT